MIHKTAIVDPKAKISANVNIGPYSIIGANVEIGEDTDINSHVSIAGYTKIGKKNKIYPFASIGNNPQDLKYNGEKSYLEIGDSNTIREYVSINPGTDGGGGLTKIGNNCLVGAGALVTENKEFSDGWLIVGSPAKAVRELSQEMIDNMKRSSKHYVANFKKFAKEMKEIK